MSAAARKTDFDGSLESLVKYVSDLISEESGNILGEKQNSMVVSRLKKRMMKLGGLSPEAYYKFLYENYKEEISHLVSLMTTHHTFFFREFAHFEYIEKHLSQIVQRAQQRGEKKIRILSAACSRGHEVYSLAMFLYLHLKKHPGMSFEILGVDIDPESVKIAQKGVYRYDEVKSIPSTYLSGNWQRGVGKISQFARVKDHIKKFCKFQVLNLLTQTRQLEKKHFDLIFCRNVFIYFEEDVVVRLTNVLKELLVEKGVFITGLSESLKSKEIRLQSLAPSVYSFHLPEEEGAELPIEAPYKETAKKIRVLVVDDSSSVVKLLSKVFNDDPDFELVGTAGNGLEAQEFLKKNRVDVMTLDIHMPEMDGVEYMRENHKSGHPKVVVVSSASREDTRYAQKVMEYGAVDFVEKPSMSNLHERADEIKLKLKMALVNDSRPALSKLDASFAKSFEIKKVSEKARVFFATYSDMDKVVKTVDSFSGDQPPLFLVFEGCKNFFPIIEKQIPVGMDVKMGSGSSSFQANTIYLCDFSEDYQEIKDFLYGKKTSFSVFGMASDKLSQVKQMDLVQQWLIEDLPGQNQKVLNFADDCFPWTSFSHVGTEFLAKDEE